MLYKSLHFKLVLLFVLFIICIIALVGTIMLNGVFTFYTDSFTNQIEESLTEIFNDLRSSMRNDDFALRQKDILEAHSGRLGINKYRNFYILDLNDGKYLAGSDDELGINIVISPITPNILAAMNGNTGSNHVFAVDYMDYAEPIIYEDESGIKRECIIYIKDTQDEMRSLSWKMVTIIMQALLIGLGIAVILSFFLANAITSPIQNITKGALKLAEGDFKKKIEVTSNDEIGLLTDAFNNMARNLQNTLFDVSSEREKLQIIFLYLKDGVLVFSDDEMLIMMNARGSEILKGDFTYDNNFYDFLELFNLKIEDKKDREKLDSKKSGGLLFKDISYSGRFFDINIGKFKYKHEQGDSEGIIVVLHDITQQYALEKSRREFIANVSHELKTPLQIIMGWTETIMMYPQLATEKKDEYMNIIFNETKSMDKIVKGLLLLSNFDNKQTMWKFELIKPDILAKDIYDSMQNEAKKKNQMFNIKIGKNIREITADKEGIEQVIKNIISNAVKYTGENGEINFTLENYTAKKREIEFSGVKFCISDNGRGIPEEDKPYIFERFYRVDKSRSTETGSTGLGLAIAQEYIHAHGGEIFVDSVINSGTTMTIILPCNINKDAENQDDMIYEDV